MVSSTPQIVSNVIAHISFEKSTVQHYRGNESIPDLDILVDMYLKVYREYPYLYEGTKTEILTYITTTYQSTKNSIISILYEDKTPIGFAMGLPLKDTEEKFQAPFYSQHKDVHEIFYWGELALLPEFRLKGLAKLLYTQVAELIGREKKYKEIAFCTIDRQNDGNNAPLNYRTTEDLWVKLGFTKCTELTFQGTWKDIGSDKDTQHTMVYWLMDMKK